VGFKGTQGYHIPPQGLDYASIAVSRVKD
jgi:hypothetical protein